MNTVPLAQRDGYDFLGWYTSDGAEFAKGFYITKDITVYPKWKVSDPTPSPTPTPTPTPEPEPEHQDDNPGTEPTSSGLDPAKFKVDTTSGTRIGLCGNILYSNFNGGKDIKGHSLKNCKLYGNGTTCSHYKACCTSTVYIHPDAPGKKFLYVPVFPGKDLSKIKLKSGGETNIPQDMVEYINKNVSWGPGWHPDNCAGQKFREEFPTWNDYDWKNFGQKTHIPAIQWPGHKFLGWYLGYDSCTSKDPTRPLEGSYDKLYLPVSSTEKESFYICADYLQTISRKTATGGFQYKGFIFYPRFD